MAPTWLLTKLSSHSLPSGCFHGVIAYAWHAPSLQKEMHLSKFRFDSLIPAATPTCGALKLSSIPGVCSCAYFQKSFKMGLFQKRDHRKRREIMRRPAMKQCGLGRRANEAYLAGIYSSLVLIGDCATLYCSDRARMSCGARMNITIWNWKQNARLHAMGGNSLPPLSRSAI
jgi:hypothetical protein